MPLRSKMGWGSEFDRLALGELASSTEARLKELVDWGGFSSFMTPSALAIAADDDIEPIGQVVGLSTGAVTPGYMRTTRPGQGRVRVGVARWREHTGLLSAWTALRTRALARLSEQATKLGANAVIGINAERSLESLEGAGEGVGAGQMVFAGTAVRLRSWSRTSKPA